MKYTGTLIETLKDITRTTMEIHSDPPCSVCHFRLSEHSALDFCPTPYGETFFSEATTFKVLQSEVVDRYLVALEAAGL